MPLEAVVEPAPSGKGSLQLPQSSKAGGQQSHGAGKGGGAAAGRVGAVFYRGRQMRPEAMPGLQRHAHKVKWEVLQNDASRGCLLDAADIMQDMDVAALGPAISKAAARGGFSAADLSSLVLLHLRLSYLHTKHPSELNEYACASGRCSEEVKLLARLRCSGFPLGMDDSRATLEQLCTFLGLSVSEELSNCFALARPWAVRTECLLVSGGDDRTGINFPAGKLANKYHSFPIPAPALVSRSSCTSSTVGSESFAAADDARENLLCKALTEGVDGHEFAMDAIRERLERLLSADAGHRGGKSGNGSSGMQSPISSQSSSVDDNDRSQQRVDEQEEEEDKLHVFTCPSGSDAELIPTMIALSRSRNLLMNRESASANQSSHAAEEAKPWVTTLIAASGEVGSGSANASGGRHFSTCAPIGVERSDGQPIAGLGSQMKLDVVKFAPRGKCGAYLCAEVDMISAAQKALAAASHAVVIVHSVWGTKTGLCIPRMQTLRDLKEEYGDRVLVVIDACQMRSQLFPLRMELLAVQGVALLTGSKFYCGPPFSGAVAMPSALLAELDASAASGDLPLGLGEFFTQFDAPGSASALRGALPSWRNTGLSMRWLAALPNMEAVARIDNSSLCAAVKHWVEQVTELAQLSWPYLTVLPSQWSAGEEKQVGGVNTIVSVVIRTPGAAEGAHGNPEHALAVADLKRFHEWLGRDLSQALPQCTWEDAEIVSTPCAMGQPVKLGGASFGVVRIALGADTVASWFEGGAYEIDERMARSLEEDRICVTKCKLMAQHWHALSSYFSNC
jgi:hypothetical protein